MLSAVGDSKFLQKHRYTSTKQHGVPFQKITMCQRHADSWVAVFLKPNHTLVTSRLYASVTHYAHNYVLMLIPTRLCRRIPHNVVLIYAMSFLVP
jgi:hypothetical protein